MSRQQDPPDGFGNSDQQHTAPVNQSPATRQNTSEGSGGGPNEWRPPNDHHPTLPLTIDDVDITCPVCLEPVTNRAYTNTCLHQFCHPCLLHWSDAHNHCPVCRRLYTKILFNVRSRVDYDEQPVEEPSHQAHGFLLMMGSIALLRTPPNTGLYVINPNETPHGNAFNIQFFGPNQTALLRNVSPDMMLVHPDHIDEFLPNVPNNVPAIGDAREQREEEEGQQNQQQQEQHHHHHHHGRHVLRRHRHGDGNGNQ